jgi:tetracycline resistance efflux pump
MIGTIYSLIPPLVMIILVLITRKVLISLGAGILVGALLLHEYNIRETLLTIWSSFYELFVSDGILNVGTVFLLSFLIFLGIMTAFMTASGGTYAFGKWASQKVKTRRGAQLLPGFLGIIIFIDDYFNSLAVGQVARPLTDRYKVSRAKLAYLIDSTSAPVTVLSPISSWGAYIIGIIGGLVAASEVVDYEPLEAFLMMIPMNIYPICALLLVFLVVILKIDLGAMKTHEQRAEKTGELVDPSRGDIPGDLGNEFIETSNGKISSLLLPIVVLIVTTITAMIITGIQNATEEVTVLSVFNFTDVNLSLFLGGLFGLLVAFLMYLIQSGPKSSSIKVIFEGIKAMLPAIYILILAWMIGTIIELLQTGEYLSEVVKKLEMDSSLLPLALFLLCGLMAFATGTSWGTFGIMLPIASEIALNIDPNMFLAALAAVLAGAVFGDHCSPISDTTILSSTGAGSNHIDHVITQLPYALIVAVVSVFGYFVLGFTGQIGLSLLVSVFLTFLIAFILKKSKN